MKNKQHILLLLTTVVMMSCSFGEQWDVDFEKLPNDDQMFQVTSVRTTDLSDGIPSDCYVMGEPAEVLLQNNSTTADGIRRSSSTTGANILQNLFNYGQRDAVVELSGTYLSTDLDGNPIRLSGKVIVPSEGKAKGIIFVSHYTVTCDEEVPSRAFPLEAVLAHLGYVMIFPDYLGYGVTSDQLHPYLVLNQTMLNEADMLFSVIPFLNAAGVKFENDPQENLMLMGYSQGGANTMALLYYLETRCPNKYIIHRTFVGGGPYDVLATYDRFIETDTAGYPVAVPLVLQGMIRGNRLNLNMEEMMQPYIYEHIDEWINSKRYTTAQVNSLINTHVTHNILSEKGMDRTSVEVSELYKAMTENSILSYSWTPKAPVYMLHSMDDETVSFVNATRARAKWHDGNIEYNFGHFGNHQMGCLRFIYSVRTLLENENNQ